MWGMDKKIEMPSEEEALPGRDTPMRVPEKHFVNGHPLKGQIPSTYQQAMFGMGCFWGAEKKFWSIPGVYTTAVGYAAGYTPNPSYQEVCTGMTGHNEVVWLVYDPDQCDYDTLLQVFFESHDPTQGMRQGNDRGTQYRSGVYCFSEQQMALAKETRDRYQAALLRAGYGEITTEIAAATTFYYAEDYHQQYLAKNPAGYCGLGGTGISIPSTK